MLAAQRYELLAQDEVLGLKPRSPREPRPDSKQQLNQRRDHRPLVYRKLTNASSRIGFREAQAYPHGQSPNLGHMPGGNLSTAHVRPQLPPELEFDADRSSRRRLSSSDDYVRVRCLPKRRAELADSDIRKLDA